MKWIDLPPVWLLGFLGLAWLQATHVPVMNFYGFGRGAGTVLACLGALLMVAALPSFAQARTTVVPRKAPSALITTGVYALSRNPIYMADLMILVGLSLRWGSILGLILAPVFVRIITTRFILGEETRLADAFGADYLAYKESVRRWF